MIQRKYKIQAGSARLNGLFRMALPWTLIWINPVQTLRQTPHAQHQATWSTQCDYKGTLHLKQHERVQTGDKPSSCSKCDYKGATSSHLKQHERVHTGDKLGFVQGARGSRGKLVPCHPKPIPCLAKFPLWNPLPFLILFSLLQIISKHWISIAGHQRSL